jgi:two-component system, chemotaxis family, chemotaxis protein CheY
MARSALAVDDSKTMREMVSLTLRGAGFDVVEAEDGRQALNMLDRLKVDLIITDLNMPHMNGLELIRRLRQEPGYRATPILMLTTESSPEQKQEGRKAGATGWVVKPFDPAKLLKAINLVCTI